MKCCFVSWVDKYTILVQTLKLTETFLETSNVRKLYDPFYTEEKIQCWLHFECILPNSQMIAWPEKMRTVNYN